MTDEEKKAADIATAEAEAKAAEEKEKADADFEASLEGLSEEEIAEKRAEKEAKETLKPDYEAELAKEKERADLAEKAAADTAFQLREEKRKKKEAGETEDPVTASQLQDILRQEREQDRKERDAGLIAEKARTLADSDPEAALIVEIHKNRTFPEGLSLDEQLEEAYAIANRKSLIAQNEELRRSLKGKDTVSKDPMTTHKDSPVLDEPTMSGKDIEAIKAVGFVWDGKSRAYIKGLGGGKKLIYDPKTKKTTRV